MTKIFALALFLTITFAAAGIGAMFGPDAWYAELKRPLFAPPNWVFGPVWTTLYALMAVAAWLVWLKAGIAKAKLPLGLFALQLALNAAWTALFFGAHRIDLAHFDIVVLWVVIAVTLTRFWQISPLAGALLAPYLAWVSFAVYLNSSFLKLNGGS